MRQNNTRTERSAANKSSYAGKTVASCIFGNTYIDPCSRIMAGSTHKVETMANVLIENDYDWTYDGAHKWDYYSSKNYYQSKTNTFIEFDNTSGFGIYMEGHNLTYKTAGKGISGDQHYYLTGGTITALSVAAPYSHTYINDVEISATQLHKLMLDGSPKASAKIFEILMSGDDDVTLGFGNDRFATFGGDDVIRGRAGNDMIDAGKGDDLLYGGTGSDKLIGGAGSDYFVFDTKAGHRNIDTITDFSTAGDMIVIDHLIYRGIGPTGDLDANAFYVSTTGRAHDRSDRIIYDSKSGELFFDADGNGKGDAVHFATLHAHLKLTAADFDIL
jgi:Ca2+-binding RTX toxin-like protein